MTTLTDPVFHLRVLGIIFVGLSLVHVIFPRYFGWQQQLRSLSLINQEMMKVHTFFVAFMVMLMGALCMALPNELATTPLGRWLCFGMALFWGARWFVQHFVYSSSLWRGKRFETAVHVLFSALWGWATVLFASTWWKGF
jgi:hypothetical protein